MAETLEGIIVKGVGGLYYARGTDGEEHVLRAKGIFRKRHVTPLVGDRILFTPAAGDQHGWVEEILPRVSELIRPAVANIQYIVIVMAPVPEPDFQLTDMLILMAARQGILPLLVVNKCDLDLSLMAEVKEEYTGTGAPLLAVSALTGEGLDELRAWLSQGVCCFAGQSGVGKSTLLSAATGLTLQTGEISRRINRGRNTTRHTELLTCGPYRILDTPGFSLLELWEGLDPVQLKAYYPEFVPYEGQCKFSPCYHLSEPGCAVLAAAAEGKLNARRLARYHTLLRKEQELWRNRYD